MKIAVPWPFLESGQPRITEALSLWPKNHLLICGMASQSLPVNLGTCYALTRNSLNIGTKVPKCYIADMIRAVVECWPDEDWYGFGNSDCVPVGDLLEDIGDREILIFHRTDIKEWKHRFAPPDPTELQQDVWRMRQQGVSDKRIARLLNRQEIAPPKGNEWTYPMIEELCSGQGTIFVCGQDLYLFRRDVVQRVMDEYIKIHDPILGTGAFDPRLTRWCMKTFNSARVLNKLFHKRHVSEWSPDDVEFQHNGGMLTAEDWPDFFEDEFLIHLCEQGYSGALPSWFMSALKKKNRPLWESLVQ